MIPGSLLAALSGTLYFLAFPGVGWWPLGFVALVPLRLALSGQSPKRGLLLGWIAGLTMTLPGFWWLLELLETFSGFGKPWCVLLLLLLCLYQAGRIGLLGWLSTRGQSRGWPEPWVFALAFTASEMFYPLVFPWFFGAVVHGVPALLQVAELGGPLLVGLVLVAANLAIAEPLLAWREHRRPKLLTMLGGMVVLCAGLAYGLVRLPAVDARTAAAPKAQVGLVQANMSLFGKREELEEGLRQHIQRTRELVESGPLQLVVWSETSVAKPIWEQYAAEQIETTVGHHLQVPTLFGAVLARPVSDSRRYVTFNSALLTDGSGKLSGRYDKHYRLPFGEFLPLGDLFPILYEWSPNSGRFAAGESLAPLRLEGHRIAVFICYEDVIPSFVRSLAAESAPDLLVNLTNDAWFGDTREPWVHLALAQMRAVEHRRFFVRSTNSGVSAVIDPAGRVLAKTRTFEETTLRTEVAWLRTTTPYELWGDSPWWLLGAVSLVLAVAKRRPPSQHTKRRLPPNSDTGPSHRLPSAQDPDIKEKFEPETDVSGQIHGAPQNADRIIRSHRP